MRYFQVVFKGKKLGIKVTPWIKVTPVHVIDNKKRCKKLIVIGY